MIFIKIKQVHTLHQNTNEYLYTCILLVYCMLLVFNVSQFIKQINIGICDCWYKKFFRDINLSQTNTYVLDK